MEDLFVPRSKCAEIRKIVYWASVITGLYWLYVILATVWPLLFDKSAVQHSQREDSGYRIGRVTLWRLPFRIAVILILLSLVPGASAIFLTGFPSVLLLALSTILVLAVWFFVPPGLRLILAEGGREGENVIFEQQRSRNYSRAILVLVVFGIIPALLLSPLIFGMLNRISHTAN